MRFIHFIYILLILFALFSVFATNLKRAIIGSSVFGLWVSVAYMLYHAPDVAIAEAVISSSLATILYIVTIKNYNDIGSKLPKLNWKQAVTYLITFASFGLVIYLTHYSEPFSESALGLMVMESFFQHGSQVNPVTGIVLNYRVFDTIFEALLLLISSVGVVHLVNSAKAKKKAIIYDDDPWHELPNFGRADKYYTYAQKIQKGKIDDKEGGHSVTLRHKKHPSGVMTITFMLPILVLISIYLIISDPIAPGGGFQGGALLSATFVSHYLIMPDHPVSVRFLNSLEKFLFLLLVAVILVYILMGAVAIFPGFYVAYFILTDALLGMKVFCGLSIMFICFSREHNKV
jgi:multicomponent Na+:H+ antiporter subunit B